MCHMKTVVGVSVSFAAGYQGEWGGGGGELLPFPCLLLLL